jgi:hypothetical protein
LYDNGIDMVNGIYNVYVALQISGTGAMPDFGRDAAPWSGYSDTINTVTIDPGATSIGSNAFTNCAYLGSITIPPSVTSIADNSIYAGAGHPMIRCAKNSVAYGYAAANNILYEFWLDENYNGINDYEEGGSGSYGGAVEAFLDSINSFDPDGEGSALSAGVLAAAVTNAVRDNNYSSGYEYVEVEITGSVSGATEGLILRSYYDASNTPQIRVKWKADYSGSAPRLVTLGRYDESLEGGEHYLENLLRG